MNTKLLQQLILWRKDIATREGVDLFRVLPNAALEAIARGEPKNEEELMSIRGIKERKCAKYGRDILALVSDRETDEASQTKETGRDGIYDVSTYLDELNTLISTRPARVRGEITSYQRRGRAMYFSLKDARDEAVLSCFMWTSDADVCGVEFEEGMEIIVSGVPNIYKPTGRMSLRATTVERVGEGALKAAYEQLKKTLESEGLMGEERKRPVPSCSHTIGILTSRDGAVIHDFLNNVGMNGYRFEFLDIRVEGVAAVRDIIGALREMKQRSLDALVVMRGGGSLESLQAFNNEAVVRELVKVPFPVIAAIGHHEDVPLASLVADKAVSTPTAAAALLNRSWDEARSDLVTLEHRLSSVTDRVLERWQRKVDGTQSVLEQVFTRLFERARRTEEAFMHSFHAIERAIARREDKITQHAQEITRSLERSLSRVEEKLEQTSVAIDRNNPQRALSLGYALIRKDAQIVRSIRDVDIGSAMDVALSDGILNVSCTHKKPYDKK